MPREQTQWTPSLNNRAWKIRKEAAKKLNCLVSEIYWACCMKQARNEKTISDWKQKFKGN